MHAMHTFKEYIAVYCRALCSSTASTAAQLQQAQLVS